MSIFKRNEPEIVEEELDTFPKKKPLVAKEKTPRKEPPKPWGKKERLIILYTFLFTILVAFLLYLSSRSWKLPNFPRVEIPKINLFKTETVTIGGGRNLQKEKEDEIIKYFKDGSDKLTGTYSFYVIDLKGNYEFGYRERNVMQAASLIKLPVFITLYQEVESGKVDLSTIYTLKSSDIRGGSGSLQYKKPGTQITYQDMAKLMGKESDNTSFNIFRNILGDQKITSVINTIGMNQTSLEDNETSAHDVSLLYKKLYLGELVNDNHKEEILGYLKDTIYEDYIPKGIPEVKVAHKYGSESNVINDAGIVLSEKPFVISILSEGIINKEADEFIPNFSKFVFEKMK